MMLVCAVHVLALATQCICRMYTPELMPCSAKTDGSTVLITEAEVTKLPSRAGVELVLQVQVNAELSSDAELEATVDNEVNPSCSSESGPCHFKLCDPLTDIEEQLFKAFGSRCPIPTGNYTVQLVLEATSSPRDAENAEHIIMELKFTDNDKPVGCTTIVFGADTNSVRWRRRQLR